MVCLLSDRTRDNPRRCFLSKEALATGSPFSPEETEDENQNKDDFSGPLCLLRWQRSALFRKRRIKKSKGVWRLNYSSPFPALLFCNLFMQLLHFRPMQFGTKMVLRVVPVVKPEQIIDLFV